MIKDNRIYLQQMLEAAQIIKSYIEPTTTIRDFYADIKTQDAIIRRMEIIGEITKRISSDLKEAYPEIMWKGMAGMRDKLIHDYDGVNYKLVWEVATKEIDKLLETIPQILEDLENKKIL